MLHDLVNIPGVKNVLVLGIGGGGDVVGSIPTYRFAKISGCNVILGALPWERFVIDPQPGPISISEFREIEVFGKGIAIVNKNSYIIRKWGILKPQIVNVLQIISEKGIVYDAYVDTNDLVKDFENFCKEFGIDLIFGIDVGGDVIAEGFEKELISPLADTYSLTILWKLWKKSRIPIIIGIFGPGVDGELTKEYLFSRIAEIAKNGHYLGCKGLTKNDVEVMEKILQIAYTEASKLPVEAFKGYFGIKYLRKGLRKAFLDISVACTYYITIEGAVKLNKLVSIIENARNILEARKLLNDNNVVTELDIEEELYSEYLKHGSLDKIDFREVINRVLSKYSKKLATS